MQYLVVDDDAVFVEILVRALCRRGIDVHAAVDGNSARQLLLTQDISRVILDLKLENESGLQLLVALLEMQPSLEVVILTGYSSISTAVEAIKLGATQYLCKPASLDEILQAFDSDQSAEAAIEADPPSVSRLEWEHIQKVLLEHGGNVSATARALGMHRRTLQRKLSKRPVRR